MEQNAQNPTRENASNSAGMGINETEDVKKDDHAPCTTKYFANSLFGMENAKNVNVRLPTCVILNVLLDKKSMKVFPDMKEDHPTKAITRATSTTEIFLP